MTFSINNMAVIPNPVIEWLPNF